MYIPFEAFSFDWLSLLALLPFALGATTTTTQIPSARTEHFFNKLLLIRALPYLGHHLFAQVSPYPKRTGNTAKFRRYGSLAAATTAISEGVNPTAVALSKTDVTVSLTQYGNVIELSDRVLDENVENVMAESSDLLGENAGNSIDQIYRDTLVGGTTVQYANGSARNAVNTVISAADLDVIINTMKRNNARKLSKVIRASTEVGTSPIRAGFFGMCHPDVTHDLEALTNWKSAETYANVTKLLENEIGSYKEIRFIESTNGKIFTDAGGAKGTMRSTTGTSADVYAVLVFASDGYGIVPLEASGKDINKTNIQMIYKPPGSAGTADALNLLATNGWKAKTAIVILNDNFLGRIECASTAQASY